MLPRHIAVIMDGNGRWAQQRGLPRSEGHKAGTEAARGVVTRCRELGIRHLTLYTLSRENLSRPAEELSFLFDLLVRFLKKETSLLLEQDIRLKVLGEVDALPFGVRQVVRSVVEKTRNCGSMTLNLALNYSGRDEILRACRALLAKRLDPAELTEEVFAAELYTAGQPDPDLIIRTSGELRLSNYLLFQGSYAELSFPDLYWPDFTPAELDKALEDYSRRQRRFGKTGDQLAAGK
ncbi:polyprenyl diphosphate synthase [Desulfovibrio aminophilus]|nr:polyprenyl diphosphate synthase [Desulfovibrio aminophilus]MCM0753667.1 polyprenyl diphosphate synthase [Desulfovibrio aminophilus]